MRKKKRDQSKKPIIEMTEYLSDTNSWTSNFSIKREVLPTLIELPT